MTLYYGMQHKVYFFPQSNILISIVHKCLILDPEKNGLLSDLGVCINQEKEEQDRLLAMAKPKTKKASSGVSFKEQTPYVPPATTMGKYVACRKIY